MKRRISTAILALAVVLLIAGCDNKTATSQETQKMDHSTMSHDQTKSDTKHSYHFESVVEDVKVVIFSQKPLVSGNNTIYAKLTKESKPLTDAKIKIKFFMPEMPGMPYMEYKAKGELEGDKYRFDINLGMSGTWQYQLKFKTNDNKPHTLKGSVNI